MPQSLAEQVASGEHYFEVLARLHRFLQPKRYLEIGTSAGDSLRLAQCASIAVDPAFRIGTDVLGSKPVCHLFQTTSDDFFDRYRPDTVLGGPIDLAFLDGLHVFEYLLRDFANAEQFCTPDSIIALHDCLPSHPAMTHRDIHAPRDTVGNPNPDWWTGDVWKVLPALRKYRPDLRVTPLAAHPTGLVLVSGLDPMHRTLIDRYDEIVAEFIDLDLATIGVEHFLAFVAPVATETLRTAEDVAKLRVRAG